MPGAASDEFDSSAFHLYEPAQDLVKDNIIDNTFIQLYIILYHFQCPIALQWTPTLLTTRWPRLS